MKMCLNCGTSNANEATFCVECGNPLQPAKPFQEQVLDRLESIERQLKNTKPYIPHNPTTKIIDFDMPFGALVGFMVKASLASIPAVIILVIIFSIISAILAVLGIVLS